MGFRHRVVNFVFESWLQAWKFSRAVLRAGGSIDYRSVSAPWTVTVPKRDAAIAQKVFDKKP